MFTIQQIETAHSKVQSGADFPNYIKEIKQLGVTAFETWVSDSHTTYYGTDNFTTQSEPKYSILTISGICDPEKFKSHLQQHQQGQTDYITFCKHCAETGIEKWIVNLTDLSCIYYDTQNNEVLVEQIPV